MPYCFVPNCQSGSKAKDRHLQQNGMQKSRFFSPGTEEKRALWESLIKRGDNKMTMDSRVCNEHFTLNDFDVNYETKLPDGTVSVIPRGKAKLKENADPSIFPKYPTYYQPKLSTRKEPTKRGSPKKPKPKPLKNVVPEIIITDEPVPNNNNNYVQENVPEDANEIDVQDVWSCEGVKKLTLPINWVVGNTLEKECKFLACINPVTLETEKTIKFTGKDQPIVKVKGVIQMLDTYIATKHDAQLLLMKIDKAKICGGTGITKKPFSVSCDGTVGVHAKRCTNCSSERQRQQKLAARAETVKKRQDQKKRKMRNKVSSLSRSKINLLNKVRKYKIQVEHSQRECAEKKEDVLNAAIQTLPENQQEAVRHMFQAAKVKGPTAIRYTTKWVYECMLLRIKDSKLYHHIRDRNILVLPCRSTMSGYLRHYSGAYGFQPQLLEMLKTKTEGMDAKHRRGVILIDEMKLTQGIYFDASTLQVLGFKDMGEDCNELLGEDFRETVDAAYENLPHDPNAPAKRRRREINQDKNKNKKDRNMGDHALVISFQPFRGQWVQAIACFLTHSNATSEELTKLILEAVVLLERSNLIVDGVVTDGASWNRSMWTNFGVTKDNPSAEHPCDPERRLWFISDFPHLLKCMRNALCTKKIIKTPQGDVKLDHWEAIIEADSLRQYGLRQCHKLTRDHIHPDPWQKMRVRMAFEFWSGSVAASMKCLRFRDFEKLSDCEGSVHLVDLINNLSDAMNSNRPANAMRLNSTHFQDVQKFLDYFLALKKWADEKLLAKLIIGEKARVRNLRAQGKNPREKNASQLKQEDYIFSDSTDIGLIVTLRGTLELVKYLVEKCNFQFVMTARLNQDALERFFGLVRQSCGGNTHPEPRVFAQLFRLLSVYSLVKPMRGSNITGGDMVATLFSLDDLKTKTRQERQKMFMDKLDEIVSDGTHLDEAAELIESVNHDHNYLLDGESIDEFALSYVAGFVARHSKRYIKDCAVCDKALKKPESERTDVDMLITSKSKGWLTFATDDLIKFLRIIEQKLLQATLQSELEENFLFVVLEKMEGVNVPDLGCEKHRHDLSKAVMKFYMIFRMHFWTRRWNEKVNEQKKKHRALRKQAHVT